MFGSLGLPELLIIGVIALIIFGPRKLPELGKALGQTIKEFKKGTTGLMDQVDQEIRREQQGVAVRSGALQTRDAADQQAGPDGFREVQVKAS